MKDGSLNLKNIEAGSKKMKKVLFFKEGKQTTWLIEKIKKDFYIIHILSFL